MQNFSLLKLLNQSNNMVLLKRGFGNTVEELIAARNYMPRAEVWCCERGIRTFSDSSRFTLDLATIPKIHQEANMIPVIVDPSHAAGDKLLVPSLAFSAVAAGADGLIIETENTPFGACCDKQQAIPVKELYSLIT
jgi:3-deoxy-7-phosphoheptulonate synthase